MPTEFRLAHVWLWASETKRDAVTPWDLVTGGAFMDAVDRIGDALAEGDGNHTALARARYRTITRGWEQRVAG